MHLILKALTGFAVVLSMSTTAFGQKRGNFPATIKTRDYTLKVDVIAEGLKDPWAIAFIDANHALITEKPGRLRLWSDGKLLPEPVKNIPVVNDDGQGGMLDVAIDPDYRTTGWVYLGYSHVQGDQEKGPAMTRIVRGKIKGGAWSEQQVLFEAKPGDYRHGPVHFGCRIVFNKAGELFFSIGERGNASNAQDITKPNGKVHRINRDGTIPKDNPFVSRKDAYPSIFSFGNRNPQGLAIHPETDEVWSTEHGPQGGDELNWIRPGINYGWPVITYGREYSGRPVGQGITEKEGMEQPVKQWTPSPALCGLDFVMGDPFPKWKNNLLVGALKFQEVKRVVLKGNEYESEEVIVKNLGRVRDVTTGPDGAIYVVLNGPDAVIRLSPQ